MIFLNQYKVGWLFDPSLNRNFNKKLALILYMPIMLNNCQKFDTKLMAQSLRRFLSFSL